MSEASPLKNEDTKGEEPPVKPRENVDNGRPVASGALRRVYKQRTTRMYRGRRRSQEDEDVASSSGEESGQDDTLIPLTRKTSNHYTLNMPAHPTPQSDLPYILSG